MRRRQRAVAAASSVSSEDPGSPLDVNASPDKERITDKDKQRRHMNNTRERYAICYLFFRRTAHLSLLLIGSQRSELKMHH